MVAPSVSGYSVIEARMGTSEDVDEVFIGKRDGEYHLLGHRPQNLKIYFSENECSSLDLGIIRLPEGKQSLNELEKGDKLKLVSNYGESEITYIKRI